MHAHITGDPEAAHVARTVSMKTQGHISGWLQSRFRDHAERTALWKQSKRASAAATERTEISATALVNDASLTVVTRPPSWKGFKATFSISFDNKTTFQTINAHMGNDTLCLEWQGTSPSRVGASLCYPSKDPSLNRDVDQHWVSHDDATVRPAKDATMCLTNERLAPDADMLFYNASFFCYFLFVTFKIFALSCVHLCVCVCSSGPPSSSSSFPTLNMMAVESCGFFFSYPSCECQNTCIFGMRLINSSF